MEYLQLFDDNKEMLDEKILRSEKKNVQNGRYFMIVLIFIENDNHRFLIQKTSAKKGSEYATTGGHVTFGDNGLVTAIKEVEEELGIKIEENEINFVDSIKYPVAYCEIYYVHKNINIKELVLQEEEVESIDWYSIDEIKTLISNNQLRKGNIEPFEKILTWKS